MNNDIKENQKVGYSAQQYCSSMHALLRHSVEDQTVSNNSNAHASFGSIVPGHMECYCVLPLNGIT
jgi:hypothetical protein